MQWEVWILLFSFPDVVAKWKALLPFYEDAERLPPNHKAVHVDVGANDGSFTAAVMRRLCRNSTRADLRFHTFEPAKKHRSHLMPLADRHCTSVASTYRYNEAAAWISNGSVTFNENLFDSRASGVRSTKCPKHTPGCAASSVASLDLAQYLRRELHDEDVNFLKLDVEGGEYQL